MRRSLQWALNHWTDAVTAKEFLRRPEVSYQDVVGIYRSCS